MNKLYEILEKPASLLWAFFILGLLTFGLSYGLFYGLIHLDILSDLPAHAGFVKDVADGKPWPVNFLYYGVLYLSSGLSNNLNHIIQTNVLLLAVFVFFKFAITFYYSQRFLAQTQTTIQSQATQLTPQLQKLLLLFFIFCLCFAFSLPNLMTHTYYLGQTPPNSWHNSTIIFLMPFAIALYYYSYKLLIQFSWKYCGLVLLFIALNVFSKPAFILAWIVVFPLMVLYNCLPNKNEQTNDSPSFFQACFSKQTFAQLGLVLFAGLLILGSYLSIFFLSDNTIYEGTEKASVVIRPFFVWSFYSKNIPLSLLLSLFFPLIYFLNYRPQKSEQKLVIFSLLLYFVSIVIYAVLAETGHRQYHGNFSWTSVVSNYMLFWTCLLLFLKKIQENPIIDRKKVIVALAFLLHTFWGFAYMVRYLYKQTYY